MKFKKEIIKLKRRILILELVILIILGGMMNFGVMMANGGLMPVLDDFILSDRHFTFSSFDEINFPFLADIFRINLWDFTLFFSIGDIFIFGGFIILIPTYLSFKLKSFNEWETERKIKRRL